MGKPSTTCRQVNTLLDIVASDALDGLSIEEHYPAVFQHLQHCSDCRQAYEQLVDALRREAAGTVLRAPNQPPPVPVGNGWSLLIEPPDSGAWRSLTCKISSSHLQAILGRSPLPADARQIKPVGQLEWLLLADAIHRPAAIVAVQVLLSTHWSSPEYMTLSVDISGDRPLPSPLAAVLQWGDFQSSLQVPADGRLHFTGIPTSLSHHPTPELSLVLAPASAESHS